MKIYRDGGGTQKKIAAATGISATTLSRYLSGERVLPPDRLRAIRAYLEAQPVDFPDGFWEEVEELCGEAHRASGSPSVQRVQLAEDLARAEADLARAKEKLDRAQEQLAQARGEHQQAQQIAEGRLHALERRLRRLTEQLRKALVRARNTERARKYLEKRLAEHDQSLRQAQDYARRIEAELAQQEEQAERLVKEVGVLRKQNRQLIEESTAVPAPSTQLSGYTYTPQHVSVPVQPGLETVAAAAEPVEAASPPQGQVAWPDLPYEPCEPYGTTYLLQQDQLNYGYGYGTSDERTSAELLAGRFADTQLVAAGYPQAATLDPYPPYDTPADVWTWDPVHSAWNLAEALASPLPALTYDESPLPAPAISPVLAARREAEEPRNGADEAPPLAPATQHARTGPRRRRAGALPTAALIAALFGSHLGSHLR
ncbi:helix-turn-helix domain-containing protein [Streptomyces albidocamelliae]|uniref:Helix-turn-helix domain-containing protein n=1 Tax=Streptomyces albidocamelliae TaxID=2981135 RepID=A0ABY6F1F0_9ACTN|nr:helix-turn-helix domain-containing protein [Streptomyces sp. HUAS 14-6]UXY40485.1 helix-turn-helix domain-containing protein [Streptomyces sp. HUAS 14-6]